MSPQAVVVERMTSSLSLPVATAVALSLVVMIAWIFRLRKRTRTLDLVAIDARRKYVELLHKNDLLIAEIDRREALTHASRTSEERYRTYIEHAPMGIFVARVCGYLLVRMFQISAAAASRPTTFTFVCDQDLK